MRLAALRGNLSRLTQGNAWFASSKAMSPSIWTLTSNLAEGKLFSTHSPVLSLGPEVRMISPSWHVTFEKESLYGEPSVCQHSRN